MTVPSVAALRDKIRQYYIKVPDAQPIGGLPESKNWVLRGPQNDSLGLHEYLAMDISRALDWWAPRTQYTEVWFPLNPFPLSPPPPPPSPFSPPSHNWHALEKLTTSQVHHKACCSPNTAQKLCCVYKFSGVFDLRPVLQ